MMSPKFAKGAELLKQIIYDDLHLAFSDHR